MKVHQGLERTLRSHTSESMNYEVAGHVVSYLLVRWLMVEAAQRAAPEGDPLGLSCRHALTATTGHCCHVGTTLFT